MSKRNGDRSRFGIERKKKMLRRLKTQALRLAIAANQETVVEAKPATE
jgi:hypothetical protein